MYWKRSTKALFSNSCHIFGILLQVLWRLVLSSPFLCLTGLILVLLWVCKNNLFHLCCIRTHNLFAGLLIINAVIGFWEEAKAGDAIAALKEQLAAKAWVKRGGSDWTEIAAEG